MKNTITRKHLSYIKIKNHPILGDINLKLINPKTNKPYDIIALVGENGCGKTTMLNELFNYNNSKFISDKENAERPHRALYLRQGSVHSNALKEVRKLIDGKDMYPNNSHINPSENGYQWNNEKVLEIVDELNDEQVRKLVSENHLSEISCSGIVSQLIDGKKHGYNITDFSSGQQEVLLKLKDMQNLCNADFVLLDEPETSLHPRWQRQIIGILREMMDDGNGQIPQIFLATHSEKVLESLIENENALIVRLFKKDGTISTESIDQMSLVLPKVTFAELDYVIFNIESYEYCNELFDNLEWKLSAKGNYGVDRAIQRSEYYDEKRHFKEWKSDIPKKGSTFTLPVYVRNYFHHPKDRIPPTKDELIEAIKLLKKIVSGLKK